jgi:cytochrome c553
MGRSPLVLAVLLSACPKPAAPTPDAGAAVAALVDDCTLATPLVPGVPGSPGHLIASERNPNGASELATHMRRMADDLRGARAAVLDGGAAPPLWAHHRKLRCAWPTALSDRNEAYDAMAQTYLGAVKALDAAPSSRAAYSGVVAACRACHEQTCDGPIAVIDGLALEGKAAP